MVALILIAYTIALILGETLRARFFPEGSRKNELFSGPFILLKLKPKLSPPVLSLARLVFFQLVNPVRTYGCTSDSIWDIHCMGGG